MMPAEVVADPFLCPGGQVLIEATGADADLICETAARVTEQLSTCNLTVPAPLTIKLSETLEANCLGLYHCGQNTIEILPPSRYPELLVEVDTGAFSAISPSSYFESILRHEFTHAALDAMPCPFNNCVVGQEYVAYTMQVRFLPQADRAAFEAQAFQDGPISRDVLNPIILMMAPDIFAQRAWQHLNERADPCGFIGQIARGEVLLDYEHR